MELSEILSDRIWNKERHGSLTEMKERDNEVILEEKHRIGRADEEKIRGRER